MSSLPSAIAGGRECSLTGTFGEIKITAPRARLQ
jgi:hypothetical protein